MHSHNVAKRAHIYGEFILYDVERSLRYFIKDGIVLRFNKVGVKTKFFSVGGIGTKTERMDEVKRETMALAEAFSQYGKIKIRKDGRHEFVLRKINKRVFRSCML